MMTSSEKWRSDQRHKVIWWAKADPLSFDGIWGIKVKTRWAAGWINRKSREDRFWSKWMFGRSDSCVEQVTWSRGKVMMKIWRRWTTVGNLLRCTWHGGKEGEIWLKTWTTVGNLSRCAWRGVFWSIWNGGEVLWARNTYRNFRLLEMWAHGTGPSGMGAENVGKINA